MNYLAYMLILFTITLIINVILIGLATWSGENDKNYYKMAVVMSYFNKFLFYVMVFNLLITVALSAEHLVEMKGMKFVPENITIKKNDTVVFRNTTNTLHNVETKDKKIKSKMLKKGEEYKHKFDKVEKVEYYCKPHKNMGMVGTVEVKE